MSSSSKNLIYSIILICILFACSGTHGKIKSYKTKLSKQILEERIKDLCIKNEELIFYDRTDDSGINRPGYFDIFIIDNEDTVKYKLRFLGNETYWDKNQDFSRFALIKINGKLNEDLTFFSFEKRKGIELFEKEVISQLEFQIGFVERE